MQFKVYDFPVGIAARRSIKMKDRTGRSAGWCNHKIRDRRFSGDLDIFERRGLQTVIVGYNQLCFEFVCSAIDMSNHFALIVTAVSEIPRVVDDSAFIGAVG